MPIIHEKLSQWFSPDLHYQGMLNNPTHFQEKTGGAKNTGQYTGLYSFAINQQTEKMLIKQGADVGETIAEYVGAQLYQLALPETSAKCILAYDPNAANPSINDLYVASIYPKTETGVTPLNAFEVAQRKNRGNFRGAQARLTKHLAKDEESLIRTLINHNDNQANHTLESIAANALWHGDSDFHTANILYIGSMDNNKKKFFKIDHGFSFFNFKKEIIDVFNPLAGKVSNVSLKRFSKGGKLVEFYPTNHFWDFAAESKRFYYTPHFIHACEQIISIPEKDIQTNIHASLENIQKCYQNNANKALGEKNAIHALNVFGKRIGMHSGQIIKKGHTPSSGEMINNIENFMVARLQARKNSIEKLTEHCREKAKKIDKDRINISTQLENQINKNADDIQKNEITLNASPKTPTSYLNKKSSDTPNIEYIANGILILKKEIEILKQFQQANDLGILEVNTSGEFIIQNDFHLLNAGQRILIKKDTFNTQMKTDNFDSIRNHESAMRFAHFQASDKILVTQDTEKLLGGLKEKLIQKQQAATFRAKN